MSAIKINGTWQRVSSIKIKQDGVWSDHTALYARLDGVWHLIDLTAEAQGPAYHVWKAYADDALGNGIVLSPEGKEYIGFAVGQRTEEPDLSDPSLYDWSLIKGADGKDGQDVDPEVLDEILEKQNSYNSSLSDVNDGLSAVEQALADADSRLKAADTALNQALQAAQVDFSNSVDSLNQSIGDLDTTLSGQVQDLDATLSGKVQDLDGSLSKQIQDLDASTAGHVSRIDTKLNGVDSSLTSITTSMNSEFDRVDSSLAAASGRIGEVENDLLNLTSLSGEQGSSITQLENATDEQAQKISVLETNDGSTRARVASLESTSGEQATRLSSLGVWDGEAFATIKTLEEADAENASLIRTLETRGEEADSKIATLESTSSSHSSRLTNVETKATNTQNRVATVEETTLAHATRLTNVETKASDTESKVSTLEETSKGHASRLTNVETKATTGVNKANAAQASADTANEAVGEVTNRVSTLEETSEGHASRLTNVETKATTGINKANAAQASADAANSGVSEVTNRVSTLEETSEGHASRLTNVETKATTGINKANAAQASADTANEAVGEVTNRVSTLEETSEGHASRLTNVETKATTGVNKANAAQASADAANSGVSEVTNRVSTLEETSEGHASRLTNVETKATTGVNKANAAQASADEANESVSEVTNRVSTLEETSEGHASRLTNVETKATTGVNKANAAQSMADSGVAKANAAQSSANTANTKVTAVTNRVSTLEETSEGHASRLTNVETKATSAVTKADNAQSTANSGVSKADAAQSTANSANTKVTAVTNRVTSLEETSEGHASRLTNVETKATTAVNKADAAQDSADSANTKVSSVTNRVGSLEETSEGHASRLTNVETKASNAESKANTNSNRVSSLESTSNSHATRLTNVESVNLEQLSGSRIQSALSPNIGWTGNSSYEGANKFTLACGYAGKAALRLKLWDAEGGLHVAFNGTEVSPLPKGSNEQTKWFEYLVDAQQGDNEVAFWSSSDGGKILRIELRGGDLGSSVQTLESTSTGHASRLTNVETKATTAVSKADAAQSTADSGVSKANAAQSTANSGVSKANAAQTAADNAQETADSANTKVTAVTNRVSTLEDTSEGHASRLTNVETKATSAVTKADNAQSTANSGVSKANAAQSSANEANSKITTVTNRVSVLEESSEGHASRLTNVETKATTGVNKANAAQASADDANTKVSSVSTRVSVLETSDTDKATRLSELEFKALTEGSDDISEFASMGAMAPRYVMGFIGTIRYGAFENETVIYVNGRAAVEADKGDTGTLSGLTEGDKVESNKPVALVGVSGEVLPPAQFASTQLLAVSRSGSSTGERRQRANLLSVYGDAEVELTYKDGSPAVDTISGSSSIKLDSGAVKTIEVDRPSGTEYFFIKATRPILAVGTNGVGADSVAFKAPSREYITGSQGVRVIKTGDAQVHNNGSGYYYSDDPFYLYDYGDGAGTDAETGVPRKMAGDTYLLPHTVYDFSIISAEPCSVKVYHLDGNLHGTYDITAVKGGRVNVGAHSGAASSGVLAPNGMFFVGSAPFAVRTNISEGEYHAVGYKSSLRPAFEAQAVSNVSLSRVSTLETTASDHSSRLSEVETKSEKNESRVGVLEVAKEGHASRLTSVETKANSGVSKAEAAQSTADSATTKANNAQSTADSATTKANNAQSTANSATTKANNAQNSADQANEKITAVTNKVSTLEETSEGHASRLSSVETKATSGVNKADAAQAKANSADSKVNAVTSRVTSLENTSATHATKIDEVSLSRSNIVTRGVFGADLSRGGWTAGSVVSTKAVGIPTLSGRPYVLKLTTRDCYDYNAQFPISVGDKIYISAWVYTTDTDISFNLGLRMMIDGQEQSKWPLTARITDRSGKWVYVEGTYTHTFEAYNGATPFLQMGGSGTMPPVYISDIVYSRSSHSGALAAVTDESKAYVDQQTGELKAERVIKADANGKVSGVHLLANGSGAEAGGKLYFQADEIAIVPPNWNGSSELDKSKFPFYFSEDRNYMYLDEATIQRLSAETIDSGSLAVDGLTLLSDNLSLPAGAVREHMIDPAFKDGIVRVNPDAEILGGTKSVSSTGIGQGKKITVPVLKSGGSAQKMTITVVGPNVANSKDVRFDLEMKVNGAPYNFSSGQSKIRLESTITYSEEDEGFRIYRTSFNFEDTVILPAPTKGNEYTYEFTITNMTFNPANTSTFNYAGKLQFSISVSEPTVSSGGFITDVRWSEVKEQPSFVALDTSGNSSYPRMVAGNNPASSNIWLRVPSTSGGLLPYSNGNSLLGTSSWKFKEIHSVNFYENGTALSSKYLGKSGKAADSSKLDGRGYSDGANANSIASRNSNGDIYARLFRSTYGNQNTIGGAIAFRNSTTDNYIRFCSDMGAVRNFVGVYSKDETNSRYMPSSGDSFTSGNVIGSLNGKTALATNDGYGNSNVTFNHTRGVPVQNGNAARIEVNTDSTSNPSFNFELGAGVTAGNAVGLTTVLNLNLTDVRYRGNVMWHAGNIGLATNNWGGITSKNASGYIDIGPANTSYAHIYTDRPSFYFNKDLNVNGKRVYHAGNSSHFATKAESDSKYLGVSATAEAAKLVQYMSQVEYGRTGLQAANVSGNGGDGKDGNTLSNPTNDWWYHIIANHSNSAGYYFDIACSFHSNRMMFKRVASGNHSEWFELFHTGKMGAGSGLDADTLQKVPATGFARLGTSSPHSNFLYVHRDSTNNASYFVQSGTGDIARFIRGSKGVTGVSTGVTIANDGTVQATGQIVSTGSSIGTNQVVALFKHPSQNTNIAIVGKNSANGAFRLEANADGGELRIQTAGVTGGYSSSGGDVGSIARFYRNGDVVVNGTVQGGRGFRRDNTGSSWISQRDSSYVGIYNGANVGNNSYAAVIRQRHASYTWTVGGLGNAYFGIFAYTNSRTVNGTDGYFRMDYKGNCTASGKMYAPDFISTSDRRVKDNIKVIPDALKKICKLTGNTYTRNDLEDKPSAGIIAQEVQEVLPEAVTETEGKLQVAHNGVIGLLVEAVKELTAKVKQLEAQVG
ncbi:alanine-zipper protein [Pseudoalteromonas sp. P1-11]|uniref:alanine-zipper protein n=1 Tax=Pseudoalteromonas sp. P1-11 TaxID=1715254 RepID=UPI0006DC02B1|nr:alanine-zipper protein [Pseudoalteromonas sp. P1-11]KPW03248.1 Chromosome partition protein Smc [Pseudoalteromonas sp. P1-11]